MTDQPSGDDIKALVARAKAGDAEAGNLLFERYLEPILYRVRRRMPERLRHKMESMDLVQTGVREAIRDIGRFEWRGSDSFYLWLCQIVENKIYSNLRHWRAQRRDERREASPECRAGDHADPAEGLPTPGPGPRTRVIEDEKIRALRAGVGELGGRQAEVMRLSLDGFTDHQISEMLGLSRQAVQRDRVSAVRSLSQRLRDLLDEQDPG
jgi:RNA polymerase sigma-70 factor (ECF subfamily)